MVLGRRRVSLSLVVLLIAAAPRLTDAAGDAAHTIEKVSLEASGYHDTDHVNVATPTLAASVADPVAGWSVSGSYLVDAVSAASVDIVSSASPHWKEVRHVGAGTLHLKPHDFGLDVGGGVSREPDYLAIAVGGSLTLDLLEKNLTAMIGVSYGDETAGRSGTSFADYSKRLIKLGPRAGVTIIVDPTTVLDLVGEAELDRGDQAKPYRYIPLFTREAAAHIEAGAPGDQVNAAHIDEKPIEQLPLERNRYAFSARLAHRFPTAALRLDERLYSDDWGMKASTTDLRYVIDMSKRAFAWPHLRVHVQTPVAFWQRTYVVHVNSDNAPIDTPLVRTGDRELGPVRSVTGGGGLRFGFGNDAHGGWALTAQGDVVYTSYPDALFITSRLSFFGALALECTWE
jgi:hypothetical protein